MQSAANLSLYISSFTAKYNAILEDYIRINSLIPSNYLLIFNFRANNLTIRVNCFYSMCSPIVLKVHYFLLVHSSDSFSISFIWASGHTDVLKNLKIDYLRSSTKNFNIDS